jgi:hypothetical protein
MILNAVLNPAHTNVITTLLTCINNYYAADNEGYLPIHLCVMGLLASQLHKNARARASTVVPHAHQTAKFKGGWEYNVPIQGSPRVTRMDAGGRDQPPPRDGRGSQEPIGTRPPHNRPYIQGSRGGSRPPPTAPRQRCYARPNHNKGNWDPDAICNACHRTGHVAANCDMLAMVIFLDRTPPPPVRRHHQIAASGRDA